MLDVEENLKLKQSIEAMMEDTIVPTVQKNGTRQRGIEIKLRVAAELSDHMYVQ